MSAMQTLDAITLSVLQNGLMQVCNEMDLTFEPQRLQSRHRRGARPLRRHLPPHSGELIAQGELGLPVFVGMMQFTVAGGDRARAAAEDRAAPRRRLHRQRPLRRRHASDGRQVRAAVLPRRQALVLALQHRPLARHRRHGPRRVLGERDRGRAGGAAAAAGQALQAKAVLDDEILSIILSNIRIADQRIGDIKAQAAALATGRARLDGAPRPLRRRHGRSRRSPS